MSLLEVCWLGNCGMRKKPVKPLNALVNLLKIIDMHKSYPYFRSQFEKSAHLCVHSRSADPNGYGTLQIQFLNHSSSAITVLVCEIILALDHKF